MIERRLTNVEQQVSRLAQAAQQAAVARQQTEQRAAQQKAISAMTELQSKLYDKAAAYTNLIMAGGYAGMFATWGATRAQLPAKANILVALAGGISLVTFVFFEIYKMIYTAIRFLKNRSLLVTPATPDVFAKNLEKIQKEEQKGALFFMPVWIITSAVAILTGLFAIGLLFYNYFALLVGWPVWPT